MAEKRTTPETPEPRRADADPWNDPANRPHPKVEDAYWENVGYLGETLEFSTRTNDSAQSVTAPSPAPSRAEVFDPSRDEDIHERALASIAHLSGINASGVSVRVHRGEVWLQGGVADIDAKEMIENTIVRLPGVKSIVNSLTYAH